MKRHVPICILVLLMAGSTALGRTKLAALPERDAVTVRLDNPAATLVEEERVLDLQQGTNHIDFSWKGVRIDPASIRIRTLSHPKRTALISVSYPPNEEALVWRVHSEEAWQEKVRISYLLSGLDRLVTYKAVADREEKTVDLKSYLVLRNYSGEDFRDAEFLLGYGEGFRTGIRHEETARMLFFQQPEVPVKKVFTWDAAKKPHDPEKVEGNVGIPVEYVVANAEASGLGRTALWGGKVRVYQMDGHGTTIFLGEDRAGFTPVGEEMELYVGDSRDVVVTQRRMRTRQKNIRRNDKGHVVVADREITDTVKIENFRDEEVTLTVVEHIPGQWEPVEFSHAYERKDHSILEFDVQVPAGGEVKMLMHYRLLNVFSRRFGQFNQ